MPGVQAVEDAAAVSIVTAAASFWDRSEVVLEPTGSGPGAWAGGPSALFVDGVYYLAYRLRRPIGAGRGYANVVARSLDGLHFTPVVEISKDRFVTDSLERPALVRTQDGAWRLYVSLATPNSKHWRVDVLESGTLEGLATVSARTVLPGSQSEAVKDPVVLQVDDRWHLWASVHPLDDPAATDRMSTRYATSNDGISWHWQGTALTGRPGSWDARGVRVSAVVPDGERMWALYDGRASQAENWEERTGFAAGDTFGRLAADGDRPLLESPHPPSGLRYATYVRLADGSMRWYFESTRPDGAHELRTVLLDPPAA